MLDTRPKGRGFEPHRRHCFVVLEQDTFIRPYITERLLMGCKESNQTNIQLNVYQTGLKIPPIPVIVIFSGHTHFLLFEDLTVHTMYIPALLLVKVSDFNTHLKQ